MMGTTDGRMPGLYLLAAYDICQLLQSYPELTLQLSFYEIYCGKLYDLLNNREIMPCREDHQQKVNIVGLSEVRVDNVEQIMSDKIASGEWALPKRGALWPSRLWRLRRPRTNCPKRTKRATKPRRCHG